MADKQEPTRTWEDARTLEELGEATAKWIEGKVLFHPCYAGTIDDETESIVETLAFFNRNGFVTTFSQPARALDDCGYSQRACVQGFAR